MSVASSRPGNEAHFALHHPVEIAEILDRLHREKILVTVEFGDGQTIVSSLLEVRRGADAKPSEIVFDVAHDAAANRTMFAAPALAFAGEIDHIPIHFETGAPTLVAFADGPAGVVAAPLAVTRLQRREWFRAALPLRPPIRCTVLDRQGHASPAQAIDLSCGGAAVVVQGRSFDDAEPGSDHELILSLPDSGRVELEATLRTVRACAGVSDALPAGVRLGFRFDRVAPKIASHIQRYVQRVEVDQLRMPKRR